MDLSISINQSMYRSTIDRPTDQLINQSRDQPINRSTIRATNQSIDRPTDQLTNQSSDRHINQSIDLSSNQSIERPINQ
jgi:hypothetical protein